MTHRSLFPAAAWLIVALVVVTMSIACAPDSNLISTNSALPVLHSPGFAQLSSFGEVKHRSPAPAYFSPVPMILIAHHSVIGDCQFQSDSFIARLLPNTSVSDRAPPVA